MKRWRGERLTALVARVRRHRYAPLKILLPTAAALGAGAAVAIGSIPGSSGTITGCYYTNPPYAGTTPYGSLRVIDPSDTTATYTSGGNDTDAYSCNTDEKVLTWNQQGPQGPTGAQGPQGAAGSTGQKGQTGGSGGKGDSGDTGKSALIEGATEMSLSSSGNTKIVFTVAKLSLPVSDLQFGSTKVLLGSATGGAGAGKTGVQTFTIKTQLNKQSAELLKDGVTSKLLPTVKVTYATVAKGESKPFLTFTFNEVYINSWSVDNKTLTLAANFKEMKSEYQSGNSKVTGQLNGDPGWNRVKNVSDINPTPTGS